MADDDDAIFVDVVPKLDESAADEAVGKLQDKFKDVTTSLGDNIKSSMSGAMEDMSGAWNRWGTDLAGDLGGRIGEHIHDLSFGDLLPDLADAVGGSFSPIKQHFEDIFDRLGNGQFGSVFDQILGGTELGDQLAPLKEIGGIFDQFKSGDAFGGLDHLADALKGSGFDKLSGTLDQLNGALGRLSDLSQLPDMSDASGLLDWVSKALGQGGDIADLLGKGGGKFGKGAKVAQSAADIARQMNQSDEGLSPGEEISRILDAANSGGKDLGPIGTVIGALGMVEHDWYDWANRMAAPPPPINYNIPNWATPLPKQDAYSYFLNAPLHPGQSGSGSPWIPGMQPMPSTGGIPSSISTSTMGVTAGTVNVTGGISIPGLPSSGGGAAPTPGTIASMPHSGPVGSHAPAPHAPAAAPHAGLGGNANGTIFGLPPGVHTGRHDGGTIPHFATGGVLPGSSPGYDNMFGVLPDGSAVGLEGGEGVVNDYAMSQPGVPELISRLNKHYDIGTTTENPMPLPGSGSPGRPKSSGSAGGKGGPTSGGQGDDDEGSGRMPMHGEGSGFSVTGGGLIGLAEQIPGMAAQAGGGMFPGGGAAGAAAAAAMQIGIQEANRAASYGGQVAGILGVEMPMDTLGLHDSRLANPAKSIIGKIGLGIAGNHGASPNMAGQTQPVLPQTQPPAEPPGEPSDPLGGAPKGPGGGPMVNIENMHVKNGGSDLESNLGRTAGTLAYNFAQSP
ncbi:hypothetical protein E2F47_23510 [Mycobacterium eburneum]|nr:hypothetical protein [Mycobacterium eburneum]TDH48487.1 hypothetical protein E2F47_23510 [Mycobacterium eburneum]